MGKDWFVKTKKGKITLRYGGNDGDVSMFIQSIVEAVGKAKCEVAYERSGQIE